MDYFGKKLKIKNKHLYWENGSPFFYLADTEWYALTKRINEKDFEKIIQKRKEQGFTAIQLVIGIPPEIDIRDDNAKSTNGFFAFNEDFTVSSKYFSDIENKIKIVLKNELVPVLFGSWGHHIDSIGTDGMKDLWTNIVNKFSGYPVIYSLCGEVDIFPNPEKLNISIFKKIIYKLPLLRKIGHYYLQNINKSILEKRIQKWQIVAQYIKSINTENHPLTVHIHTKRLATEVFPNSSWIDIDSFQSGHSLSGIDFMNECFNKLKNNKKAYCNLEPLYEGILGQTDTRLQNYSFWKSIVSGAIGHSYGAHGIWQMSTSDNFMGHWGNSNWENSLEYPGAESIGNAKKFLQQNNILLNEITCADSFVEITYKSNPKMYHIAGMAGKIMFIYIPYPELISSIKLPKVNSSEILDAATFSQISKNITPDFITKNLQNNSGLVLKIERV